MLIVHILTNLHLPMADTMQIYIKQTHWITLMQICTNEKIWYYYLYHNQLLLLF